MIKFLGKRLLIVTAHPDDESFAVAGTILQNKQAGGQAFLICATLGERGQTHFKKPISLNAVKKIRKTELNKVVRFLGIKKSFSLNLPDTKLPQREKKLKNKVTALVQQLKVDYILSFGPDGYTGHKDHITVGKVAQAAATQFKLPFIKFYAPPSFYKHSAQIKKRRKFGKYATKTLVPQPNLKIKINAAAKRRVITFHKSQLDSKEPFQNIPNAAVRELLNYEYFGI